MHEMRDEEFYAYCQEFHVEVSKAVKNLMILFFESYLVTVRMR